MSSRVTPLYWWMNSAVKNARAYMSGWVRDSAGIGGSSADVAGATFGAASSWASSDADNTADPCCPAWLVSVPAGPVGLAVWVGWPARRSGL